MEVKVVELVGATRAELNALREGLNLANTIRGFTTAMTEKVAAHINDREGWDDEEYAAGMYDALMKALDEGDYVSVANYSMFLHGLGYKPGRSGG